MVVDLGYGLPVETAMRSCAVGTGLARRMGMSEQQAADVFYVSLLLHVGCLAYSHETTVWFGDDAAVHRAVVRTNSAWEVVSVLLPEATRGLPAGARAKSLALLAARGPAFSKRHERIRAEHKTRLRRAVARIASQLPVAALPVASATVVSGCALIAADDGRARAVVARQLARYASSALVETWTRKSLR